MQRVPVVQWFGKWALSTLMLLSACGLATAWFGSGLQLPSTTVRDGATIALNRYATEPVPDVVLVGSSLTLRLNEEYFATRSLRNLAIGGGSPLTGLEIVANQPRLPKIILVETNVLSRSTDAALVERYSRRGSAEPVLFRPIRTAVAAYENWRHAAPRHEQVSSALSRLLEQSPSEFDNRIYAERALEQHNAEDPAVNTRMNVERIQQLMLAVEQRGSRLLLFELPYSAPLEQSRSVKITKEIVQTKFSGSDRWLHLDLARGELRWADGVHLDARSALIVSQSIDKALSSVLGDVAR